MAKEELIEIVMDEWKKGFIVYRTIEGLQKLALTI